MEGVRFGDTVVMDDLLTEGPTRASRHVGRAQGTYVTASLSRDHREGGGGGPAMTNSWKGKSAVLELDVYLIYR
nr:unnamed protein product [Digitaria exilis]